MRSLREPDCLFAALTVNCLRRALYIRIMNSSNIKIILIVITVLLAGLFLNKANNLGEPYITTGEVVSFDSAIARHNRVYAASVKLENGHESLIKNKGFSIGDIVNLKCYRTEENKTEICKIIE